MEDQDTKILWIVPDDFTVPELYVKVGLDQTVAETCARICMRHNIVLCLIGNDGKPLDLDLKAKDINDERLTAKLQHGQYIY
jgi:hypothetical protein